jgi:hypothetical protein
MSVEKWFGMASDEFSQVVLRELGPKMFYISPAGWPPAGPRAALRAGIKEVPAQ